MILQLPTHGRLYVSVQDGEQLHSHCPASPDTAVRVRRAARRSHITFSSTVPRARLAVGLCWRRSTGTRRSCRVSSVLHDRTKALLKSEQPGRLDEDAQPSTSYSNVEQLFDRAKQQLTHLLPSLSPRIRGLILLNILVLLCGANWVVLKEAEDFFDPFTFAALRFTLAAAAFSPWIKNAVKDRATLMGGLELGIYSALAYMLQAVGLATSDASRASFISTFTVSHL